MRLRLANGEEVPGRGRTLGASVGPDTARFPAAADRPVRGADRGLAAGRPRLEGHGGARAAGRRSRLHRNYQRVKMFLSETRPRIAAELAETDDNPLTGLHRRFEVV